MELFFPLFTGKVQKICFFIFTFCKSTFYEGYWSSQLTRTDRCTFAIFLKSAHPTVKHEGSLVINSKIELNALQRDILEKHRYFTTRTTQHVDLTLLMSFSFCGTEGGWVAWITWVLFDVCILCQNNKRAVWPDKIGLWVVPLEMHCMLLS